MGTLATLLAGLGLLAFASTAPAAPPSHPRLEAEDLTGVSRACGVATDRLGSIYVASPGDDAIKIFEPSGTSLGSIANPNDPCGLAVDGQGNLYVSETATGEVVRYSPVAFPFVGPPEYGGREVVDSSGDAQGIAIDPSDDRLYVALGDRVAVYKSDSSFLADIGEGVLEEAKGVAVHTFGSGDLRLGVADSKGDVLRIFSGNELGSVKLRRTVAAVDHDRDPETPGQDFGFGPLGTPVAADGANGHFLLYDDAHQAVDEFDASGEFLDQILDPGFADAEPTGIAVYPDLNELQQIEDFASGGTFTLSFEGEATAPISHDAEAGEIQAALQALASVGEADVAVRGKFSGSTGKWVVEFHEALGSQDVPAMTTDASGLTGGPPVATVKTLVEGSGPGRVYVGAGAGPGAELLVFKSLPPPSRQPQPGLSHELPNSQAVATDLDGNVYVAADKTVHIFDSEGAPTAEFTAALPPFDLAVDSAGGVYALENRNAGDDSTERVSYYAPPSYAQRSEVVNGADFEAPPIVVRAIDINPVSGHLFVSAASGQIIEVGTVEEEWPIINPCFACTLPLTSPGDIAINGANGTVYVSDTFRTILAIDPSGTEVMARINGDGSPLGGFPGNPDQLAIDQANGHVLQFSSGRLAIEEFDAAGAYVGRYAFPAPQGFTDVARVSDLAMDNSGGVSDGSLYLAYDDPGTPDLWAFGPLEYGGAPGVRTGTASGIDEGAATLNGTVDPRGLELEDCHFEYLPDNAYRANLTAEDPAFLGAMSAPCSPETGVIGHGSGAVAVSADLNGLDPEGRYRFRLVAENEFGESQSADDPGYPGLFGPPLIAAKSALPVLYGEATLRAGIDPSGLTTSYRFQYGDVAENAEGEYDRETAATELSGGDGEVAVKAALFGLDEGTEYRFRVVAENEAATMFGPERAFRTLRHGETAGCPNADYRTGLSAALPDCRAYELVTPAETRGYMPGAALPGNIGELLGSWMVTPRGAWAGESLGFSTYGTLPGFDGNGEVDTYRSRRAAGQHPAAGWSTELLSPSYADAGGGSARPQGLAPDHSHAFFSVGALGGGFLTTTSGLEPIGSGSLGTDPDALGRFLSTDGKHVIFASDAHLESQAPPADTTAIYDREVGSAEAEVISLLPGGGSFGTGEDARFLGANETGTAVVFEAGGSLYLHRGGESTEIAEGPSSFAGVSEDGKRVLFADVGTSGDTTPAADLVVCDVDSGLCVGGGELAGLTEIAEESIFIDVSSDGTGVLFSSEDALTGAEENDIGQSAELGQANLYAWDGSAVHFVAILDASDFEGFGDEQQTRLGRWSAHLAEGRARRAFSPTRSTPDGSAFVFQSHAKLSGYDNEGTSQVYRYALAAPVGERLLCVSCDPTAAPPSGDATLQTVAGGFLQGSTLIPNLTDDGEAVFFESPDDLLPGDASEARDVYEWKASGALGCEQPAGCLGLISSGQSEADSFLFGMSADGRDVLFETGEKLVGADVAGSPSVYDARREGGIPDPATQEPCHGDACQGVGSEPPALAPPASAGTPGGTNVAPSPSRRPCRKGERKFKVRCVKGRGHKRRHHHHRRTRRPHR